jgi:hypothetical protein
MSNRRIYTAGAENLTLLADAGDFFNLEGGSASMAAEILEVRVWQRGAVTLVMDSIIMRRGIIVTPAGTAVTEYLYDAAGTANQWIARSLPTADVASTDLEIGVGFNLLQQAQWLPTPELQIPLKANDDFGIFTSSSVAHTGVGIQVSWAEFGV